MSLTGRGVNEFLQVSDQVLELWHLDIALDHITRVEMPDGIHELLQGIIVLLLFIQVISMLLRDFRNDLLRELGGLGNFLGLCEQTLLQKGLNLNVVLHLIHLMQLFRGYTTLT